MIQVFFNNRGSGKTKDLINLANEKASCCKGNVVFIDDDERPILELDRKIRFISTRNFRLDDYNGFYGFLCGILSEDYDIDTICIDGLSNIIPMNIEDAAHLFSGLENLTKERDIQLYININSENKPAPEFIKKYVA
ncbi:MAG: hypothetical protein H7Y18_01705 [Clostridiaceae bacterium]|nr:hypothetical protein [Clostridiaceae bacterium]